MSYERSLKENLLCFGKTEETFKRRHSSWVVHRMKSPGNGVRGLGGGRQLSVKTEGCLGMTRSERARVKAKREDGVALPENVQQI